MERDSVNSDESPDEKKPKNKVAFVLWAVVGVIAIIIVFVVGSDNAKHGSSNQSQPVEPYTASETAALETYVNVAKTYESQHGGSVNGLIFNDISPEYNSSVARDGYYKGAAFNNANGDVCVQFQRLGEPQNPAYTVLGHDANSFDQTIKLSNGSELGVNPGNCPTP